jgi:type II secretory ATPase GspE/PulE/Tfp pilus assembly ATPase PilB-like protein
MAPTASPSTILPRVVLKKEQVPFSVLHLIPFETAQKFQVVAFEMNATVLKLALVHPEQLKQGFYVALKDIGTRVGRKIEIFQTDASSMQGVLKVYKQELDAPKNHIPTPKVEVPAAQVSTPAPPLAPKPQVPAPLKPFTPPALPTPTPAPKAIIPAHSVLHQATDPKPPLFELGKTVAYNYLKRIPLSFALEHRLMCVDFVKPNIYWFVTDGSDDKKQETLIPLIEGQNKIKIYTVLITAQQFNELFQYYSNLLKQENTGKLVENQKEIIEAKQRVAAVQQTTTVSPGITPAEVQVPASSSVPPTVQAEQNSEPKLDKDVIESDVQAAIISTEEEKGGLAGLFQKMSQSMSAKKEDDIVTQELEVASPVPAVANSAENSASVPAVFVAGAAVPAPTNAAPSPVVPVAAPVADPAPGITQSNKQNPSTPATTDDTTEIGKLLPKAIETLEELKEQIRKGFIPRIVAAVVSFAIHEKASDIHIEVFDDEVRVRYREDGQLIDVVKLAPDVHAAMVSRIKILSRLRLDETRVPQDGRFDVNFGEAQVDLRVSVMPTVHGEKVVMRILDKSKGVVSLESLGILGLSFDNLTKAINKPFGVCLATGPTGSGKSTTLYAILNRIATPNVNVITLEDPVEYEMKGINQSQVRPKIGFTFAEGLRAVLRQDPNIIMVGEIRDGETANMATQAALTGHLVLSTLHTNDAAGAIPRLSNMGIEPFLISSSINAAIGQRLVRKICQNCKSEINMPAGIREKIEQDLMEIEKLNPQDAARVVRPFKFYQGTGCIQCKGKGYQGRLGIYEVLVMSEAIEELALKHSPGSEIQAAAQKDGMLTMYQDGLLKVIAGITTLDEVLRETSSN